MYDVAREREEVGFILKGEVIHSAHGNQRCWKPTSFCPVIRGCTVMIFFSAKAKDLYTLRQSNIAGWKMDPD